MRDVTSKASSNKLRLVARVMLFWGGYLAVLWLASFVKAPLPPLWDSFAWGLTSCAVILPLSLFFLRRENRKARDIGLMLTHASFLRFTMGFVLGFIIFGFQLLAVAVTAGPIRFAWTAVATPSVIIAAVLSIFALACMEELGFRGYPLRTLVSGLGLWPAQGIVAVAFGLCHLAFGWTLETILLGVIPSALLFGMAAVSSRGLAIPIGLHTALNLAQSSLRACLKNRERA